LLNNLNDSINLKISDSVIDLIKCIICLGSVNEPLSCPNCNNFACKKCLEKYFNSNVNAKCPICKGEAKLSQFKENRIINEVQNILTQDSNNIKKIDKLSKLIEQKKKDWFDQSNELDILIQRTIKYQESLEDYKRQYHLFFLNCEKLVKDICEKQSKKLQELIDNMLTYNNDVLKKSIKQFDNKIDKNQNNIYSQENFKNLINEILSMERKHFNEKNKNESESLLKPIKIVPSINNILLKKILIKKENFLKPNFSINLKGYKFDIGDYNIIYLLSSNNGHKIMCKVDFPLIYDNKCYFLTQNKVDGNNNQGIIPMQMTNNKNKYVYECIINIEEFDTWEKKEIYLGTEVTIFSI
jgi:hypothetical protein